MKIINKINDELIEIREYAKPNACFQTNEYPNDYDFCILKEQFNPFDLFNDNKRKDKEIERLNNIINDIEEYTIENIEVLENRLNSPFCNFEKVTKGLLIFQNYLDKLKELKENK